MHIFEGLNFLLYPCLLFFIFMETYGLICFCMMTTLSTFTQRQGSCLDMLQAGRRLLPVASARHSLMFYISSYFISVSMLFSQNFFRKYEDLVVLVVNKLSVNKLSD